MHVLMATHQVPAVEIGGVGLFSVHLAEALRGRGHRVTLLSGSEERVSGPCRIVPLDGGTHGVPGYQLLRSSRESAGAFLHSFINPSVDALLVKLLDELRPEIVHIQHTLDLSARLTSLALASGAGVVASVHDFWPICQRLHLRHPDGTPCRGPRGGLECAGCLHDEETLLSSQLRHLRRAIRRTALAGTRLGPFLLRTAVVQGCYARAHRLTCPSTHVAGVLVSNGFPPDRVRVVDYGIPPLPAEVARVSRPRNPLILGYMGTLGEHKGLAVLLKAMRLLQGEPIALEVHGGPLRDAGLRRELALAEEEGLSRYRGPYRADELPGVLRGLDALAIPSLWPETGPMVFMEAMSAGLPVVASSEGSLPLRLDHGVDGLLVPAGDHRRLAQALRQLLAEYDTLRRGALKKPVRTVENAAIEMEQVYDEALAEARAR